MPEWYLACSFHCRRMIEKEVRVTATAHPDPIGEKIPRFLTKEQLLRLGAVRLNRYGVLLECAQCGATWSTLPNADGSLPPGFTKCPNRCNW